MKNSQTTVGKTRKSAGEKRAATSVGSIEAAPNRPVAGKSVPPGKVARIEGDAEGTPPTPRKASRAKAALRSMPVGESELQQMIRQEAYFRAERRGFGAGNEWQDWFEAEQEVYRQLKLESPTH